MAKRAGFMPNVAASVGSSAAAASSPVSASSPSFLPDLASFFALRSLCFISSSVFLTRSRARSSCSFSFLAEILVLRASLLPPPPALLGYVSMCSIALYWMVGDQGCA